MSQDFSHYSSHCPKNPAGSDFILPQVGLPWPQKRIGKRIWMIHSDCLLSAALKNASWAMHSMPSSMSIALKSLLQLRTTFRGEGSAPFCSVNWLRLQQRTTFKYLRLT